MMNQVAPSFSTGTSADFDFASSSSTPASVAGSQTYNPYDSSTVTTQQQHQQYAQSIGQARNHAQPSQQYVNSPLGFASQQASTHPNAYGMEGSMIAESPTSTSAHHPYLAGQPSYSSSASAPGPQNLHAEQSHTSTPPPLSQSSSIHSTGAALLQQSAPPQQPTPPNKFPMAAPPLPHTPANPASSNGSQAAPSPKTPSSPHTQIKERRVALLLEINTELLQEVQRLQIEGKGGALSPQQQVQLRTQGLPDTAASDEYIQCLRRAQANLGYLSSITTRQALDPAKILPGPAVMTAPPHMPSLQAKYERLRELFPGWQGHTQRPSQHNINSPNPNQATSTMSPSTT